MSIGQCGILSMIRTPINPDLKKEKSINVASFLYRGHLGTQMEYLSSIVFDTVRVAKNYVNRTVWNTIDDAYSNLSRSQKRKINKCGFVSI